MEGFFLHRMNNIFTGKDNEGRNYGYSKAREGFPPNIRYNYVNQDAGYANHAFVAFSVPIICATEMAWNIDPNYVSPHENVVMGRVIGQWLPVDDIHRSLLETQAQRDKRAKKKRAVKRLSKLSLSSSDSYDSSLAAWQARSAAWDWADNPSNPDILEKIYTDMQNGVYERPLG